MSKYEYLSENPIADKGREKYASLKKKADDYITKMNADTDEIKKRIREMSRKQARAK